MVAQVKDMFPALPDPAIQAALQKWPVGLVIEKALAGQVDPTAVPTINAKPPPAPKPKGGKVGKHEKEASICVLHVCVCLCVRARCVCAWSCFSF